MSRSLAREDSVRLAQQYIRKTDVSPLSQALADPSCPAEAILATLLYASGFNVVVVSANDPGLEVEFHAGATAASTSRQLSYNKSSQQLSGGASDLVSKVYLLLNAIEHELDAAIYLPPDMRRDRVLAVCNRVGVDEDFFRGVLRGSTL